MRTTLISLFVFSFIFTTAVALVPPNVAYAASPSFVNLSQSDFDAIIEDLGALYSHTSVSPASTLGEVFGFEVGLIVGAAQVPGVEKLVEEADPTADVSVLPHAGFLGAVSVPMGFKFEVSLFPEKEMEDVEFKFTSFAVQWTLTQSVVAWPFDFAIKAHSTSSTLGYVQDVSGTDAAVTIENKITGLTAIASKKLAILEPYVGFGVVKVDGEMGIAGSNEFFDFTNEQAATSSTSGSQFFVGTNLNILFLKLGAEVGKIFDATKASVKLSMAF
jgi:hypothetical protein